MEMIIVALTISAVLAAFALGRYLGAKSEKTAYDKRFNDFLISDKLRQQTIKIEDLVVAIELSDRSINDISHRKQTEGRLAYDLAKELSERCLIRYECAWYRDRNVVKVIAHLRALPMDERKRGKPYIYKPLHSETI